MSLFDDAVGFLGGPSAVREVEDELHLPSTGPTRMGVIMSLPVVIANLARWTADPESSRWLTSRLTRVDPESAQTFTALRADHGLRELGAAVHAILVGDQAASLRRKIATRAEVDPRGTHELMSLTTAAVLALLTQRHHQDLSPDAVAADLEAERDRLAADGWDPWMTETAVVPEAPAGPAPPVRPDRRQPAAAASDGGDTGSTTATTTTALADAPEPEPAAEPAGAAPRRRGRWRRRLVWLMVVLVVVAGGVAAAAVGGLLEDIDRPAFLGGWSGLALVG